MKLMQQKLEGRATVWWKLHDPDPKFNRFRLIYSCDRRSDGRAMAYTRYSIYAVARKKICPVLYSIVGLLRTDGRCDGHLVRSWRGISPGVERDVETSVSVTVTVAPSVVCLATFAWYSR